AQSVDAEALDPVQGIPDQVIQYLAAAVIEDQRVPVLVEAFARIGMFVQAAAVEMRQAVGVGRKMARHPVEQYADAVGMRGLDEITKIFRAAEARRRRIQTDRLVTPGAVEGMLADRQ